MSDEAPAAVVTRSQYVNEHYDAALATYPLLDAGRVIRKLEVKYDALHRLSGTPCTGDCNPSNCEAKHREHFGWDLIEAGLS